MSSQTGQRELFFVSKDLGLPAGIVHPGSWGRGFDTYEASREKKGDPWKLITELAVENERLRRDPNLPSRFACCFAFLSFDDARKHVHALGADVCRVWACELLYPQAPEHVGDFGLFDGIASYASHARAQEVARRYWAPRVAGDQLELVTQSPLRLTAPVADFRRGVGWGVLG